MGMQCHIEGRLWYIALDTIVDEKGNVMSWNAT